MNFHFEYFTAPVFTYSIDQPLVVTAGILPVQGYNKDNSDIPLLQGITTLSEYVNFLSSLQNVQNLTLAITLGLEGDAVLLYNGALSKYYFGSTKVRYRFYFFSNEYTIISGEKDYDCSDYDYSWNIYNLTYFLKNIQGQITLPRYTNVEDIKQLVSNPNNFSYKIITETEYEQDNTYFVSLQRSFTCKGQIYNTTLKFSVFYTLSGDFTCNSETLDNPLCKLVLACNDESESHRQNCIKYFDMYRLRCQNDLSSDFCYNFVQNYYNIVGPQSQIDALLKQYCSNKNPSEIFRQQGSNTERDSMLCGCHMTENFYNNFHNSIKQYTESKGYKIDESLFGQKQICLFPPCTISSTVFPAQEVGKCDNDICFNIIRYENDGSVKNNENITIVQDSNCFVRSDRPRFKDDQAKKHLEVSKVTFSDILLLIVIVIVLMVFVFMLRLYNSKMKTSNKKYRFVKLRN